MFPDLKQLFSYVVVIGPLTATICDYSGSDKETFHTVCDGESSLEWKSCFVNFLIVLNCGFLCLLFNLLS